MEYWSIELTNYRGNNDIYYFANYEVARETFNVLAEKHKNDDEFSREDGFMEWFDSSYNEYSTYAELKVSKIFIFDQTIDIEL